MLYSYLLSPFLVLLRHCSKIYMKVADEKKYRRVVGENTDNGRKNCHSALVV